MNEARTDDQHLDETPIDRTQPTNPASRTQKPVRVGVADVAVSTDGTPLATSGLGSCVAVAIYDADESGLGGLLHAMLPAAPDDADPDNPPKYVDAGIHRLVDAVCEAGCAPDRLAAKFAGGSAMLDIGIGDGIGERNVAAAEAALERHGIAVRGEDTGGDAGRSVRFHPQNGDYVVERVDDETRTL